ncbi:MAG: type II toxin-antitoxin system RelE/ParE family toxin [Acidimicrobiia bacterium]|nr:type II toxin-antitoxin system RelE/ParE family toxin [Acidimicrobiia bacterium]MDH5522258.1 type II toxin-antitoxin system RelE/ParE family toxin [Acidimicrobiia bacterium]
MSRYHVVVARRAVKSIAKLRRVDQQRVRAAIDLLADEPRPPGCTKLAGEDSVYRVRVGDYRIVYEVIDARLVVHVVRVGHRRDVYR